MPSVRTENNSQAMRKWDFDFPMPRAKWWFQIFWKMTPIFDTFSFKMGNG